MFENIKKTLYFPIASYFKFFATMRLRRWNPRVVVVTGSNGKTTLLHMLEAQLGAKAKVSHHANSAYGVSFDILDLHRKTLQQSEWISLFLNAPRNVFKPVPKENIYVVEADADRPDEGKFLASLLKPEVVLWISTSRTHSMNFDHLVAEKKFITVEEAIAYEYGHFLENCTELSVIDGDSDLETAQISRASTTVTKITQKEYLQKYTVTKEGTSFTIQDKSYVFKGLLPEEIYLSIAMCKAAVTHLGLPFDAKFTHFHLPPGRGSLFSGKKDTVLIDSTYNGNLGSMKAMLSMFDAYPAQKKWVVLGDMKELGKEEQEEHECLAYVLNAMDVEHVILIGRAVEAYTLPLINKKIAAVGFSKAPEAATYLEKYIRGGEAILFKGSQSIYLEGLLEPLLQNKGDATKLPRQDIFWKSKRKKLGFN